MEKIIFSKGKYKNQLVEKIFNENNKYIFWCKAHNFCSEEINNFLKIKNEKKNDIIKNNNEIDNLKKENIILKNKLNDIEFKNKNLHHIISHYEYVKYLIKNIEELTYLNENNKTYGVVNKLSKFKLKKILREHNIIPNKISTHNMKQYINRLNNHKFERIINSIYT